MLRFENMITCVDAHTGGEPLRVITAGYPRPLGAGILEKRRYLKENFDHLRTMLMLEPRGHSGMYGCLITEPATEDGDFGVVFMHNEGYSDMCGHGIIAVSKVAVETGVVTLPDKNADSVTIRIDSPAGRITAHAHMQGGHVRHVSFENVPSFVLARDVAVPVQGIGQVTVDVAFGGAFYAYVDAAQLDIEVVPENIDRLVALGEEIKARVRESTPIAHPLEPELCELYGTIICDSYSREGGVIQSRNVCIFADAQIDRSPTGTGTSGRMAQLYTRGLIDMGDKFVNTSIIGTKFSGRILEASQVGAFQAVHTTVGGAAHITGFSNQVLEPEDEVGGGFRITGG